MAAATARECGCGSWNCGSWLATSALPITVCHLPPGASKWNRIEHRLFSFIIGNWRGKPLVSHQVIVQLIAATTAAINLTRRFFHGEWNYAINPNPPARKR
jgi:hypothetical protein